MIRTELEIRFIEHVTYELNKRHIDRSDDDILKIANYAKSLYLNGHNSEISAVNDAIRTICKTDIEKRFISMVKDNLKSKNFWLSDIDIETATNRAINKFLSDYDDEDSAVEDAVNEAENKLYDFNITLSFHGGILSIGYGDGSDVETHQIHTTEDIIGEVHSTIEDSLMEPEAGDTLGTLQKMADTYIKETEDGE